MKRAPLLRCLVLCLATLAVLSFPALTGCSAGGKETQNNHVFAGDAPVNGAVQVATNKPIPILSIDTTGKTNFEERDCGQFILMPPHYYRDVRERLEEYNAILERYPQIIEEIRAGAKGAPSGSSSKSGETTFY